MAQKSKAFSLTELMIVLVIIALLFSALAPIITKRHIAETHENESIWNYIPGDATRNAYFDPGVETWTSSVYAGIIPTSSNEHSGKLVVNSGPITYNDKTYNQPQMQFRFSKNPLEQGRGINAANLYLDGSNIIFGSSLSPYNGEKSTIYGLSNLTKSINAFSLTAMGSQALGDAQVVKKGSSENPQYITAIGHRAGNNYGTENSSNAVNAIYIGSNAGAGTAEIDNAPSDNIAIGYESMSKEGNAGSHNVFVGAFTGNGFSSTDSSYNTIVGSAFSRDNASYNTIIGYGVYNIGDPLSTELEKKDIKAMTAIGYGACNSLYGSNSGARVCLGYNSGYSTNNTPESFSTDTGEHIFIGGKPETPRAINSTSSGNTPAQNIAGPAFPGRSILEVHNNTINGLTYGNVVINSNLVIRGNFFPSDGNNLAYNIFNDTQTVGAETPYYRCSSDAYQSILTFNSYVCKSLSLSNPKSINLLYKGGNCNTTGGYPNGGGCPDIFSSDVRLKNIISENNDGLDKILKIQSYNFTYKNGENKPQVGVIAQELQKIFPNAVSKGKDGFLKIRTEDMFYALVNAIKTLAAKVDELINKTSYIENTVIQTQSEQNDINKKLSSLDKRLKKIERKSFVNVNE